MNKVYLYSAADLAAVNFLFFNAEGQLLETVVGTLEEGLVWEALVPNLPAGLYTVVGVSGGEAAGQERIRWDGAVIVDDVTAIASGVRLELSEELAHLVSLQNGLTTNQATMLLEIYRLMGLDPSRPLYVSKTARTVLPEIDQVIDDNGVRTIVTRS